MRDKSVLIPLFKNEIAPRFDLALAVMITMVGEGGVIGHTEEFMLPHAGADGLCDLILRKDVDVVICGGIEEEYYHYLRWRRIEVLDNVAGLAQDAMDRFARGQLKGGEILFPR